MLDKVKCECGHANPVGTQFCESCGKPFDGEDNQLLNMRYEGAARRSQVYQKTIIDHIWNFFSSVKVGVWLIAITLVVSMLGTIYPQIMYIPSNVDPLQYYQEEYGRSGYLYVLLGLHQMYSSWWYVGLLSMIGVSLIICSVDRVWPLYRALKKQRVTRHLAFLSRQKIFGKGIVGDGEQAFAQVRVALKKRNYTIREEAGALLAEKGRFSRWGPYVNHIGLIIFLIGCLIRILPGFQMEDFVWIREGETAPVSEKTNYYVKSEGFQIDLYDAEDFPALREKIEQGQAFIKEFRTDVILYEKQENPLTKEEELVEVKKQTVKVNDPLVYKGLKLFQYEYIPNELSQFTFALTRKESGEILGSIDINLYDPAPYYEIAEGFAVELISYFPDFDMDKSGEAITKSNVPNNPAFAFKIISPENPKGDTVWIMIQQTIEIPGQESDYALKIQEVQFNSVSGLLVRQEKSMSVIITGGIIFMIGVTMGFYWNHRRIWIQREGSELWIAAHTNKNWFGLKREVDEVVDLAQLKLVNDLRLREDGS